MAHAQSDGASEGRRQTLHLAQAQPDLADATRRQLREINEARIARLTH